MIVEEDVPFSVGELTAEWLSRGLHSSGLLHEGSVEKIELRTLGDQVGFNGEVVIVSPTYAALNVEESKTAPKSLVLKIPTASKNRILGQTMGLYEKEIRFYRDLQPIMNIRTPKHYCSALDIADDPDVILERLQGMNRLPIWVIRGIMALAGWIVTGNPRKYALLIEDLSEYRMGDQAKGCSDEDVKNVICTMAQMHAQFWDSKELAEMTWISPYAVVSRMMQMRYLQSVGRFVSEEGGNLTQDQRDMLNWLKVNGIALTERFGEESATLLHGDCRLDNICFDDKANQVVVFDWQTMQAGPGAADLAYFISATLSEEDGEDRVNALIEYYLEALNLHGITLNPKQLRWQYEAGMLLILHRLLPAIYDGNMDLNAERGLPLMKAWLMRILKRLTSIDPQRLLKASIPR